jgi:hypothetical protein
MHEMATKGSKSSGKTEMNFVPYEPFVAIPMVCIRVIREIRG